MKTKIFLLTFLFFQIVYFSCSGLYDAIVNVQRLQFKLGRVNNLSVAGIRFNDKSKLSDFNVADAATLMMNFTSGKFPMSFTLNVLAKNPNDGTGGTKNTSAVLKSLAWRLFLDDKETINGNIDRGIEIPGVGQETTIPIDMSLDLIKFFRDTEYSTLINLALALGGVQGSSAKIKLKAVPTVETVFGPMKYPGELTIVDTEFRGE